MTKNKLLPLTAWAKSLPILLLVPTIVLILITSIENGFLSLTPSPWLDIYTTLVITGIAALFHLVAYTVIGIPLCYYVYKKKETWMIKPYFSLTLGGLLGGAVGFLVFKGSGYISIAPLILLVSIYGVWSALWARVYRPQKAQLKVFPKLCKQDKLLIIGFSIFVGMTIVITVIVNDYISTKRSWPYTQMQSAQKLSVAINSYHQEYEQYPDKLEDILKLSEINEEGWKSLQFKPHYFGKRMEWVYNKPNSIEDITILSPQFIYPRKGSSGRVIIMHVNGQGAIHTKAKASSNSVFPQWVIDALAKQIEEESQ